MEANEMAEELLLQLDRIGSQRSKGYEDSELSTFLTDGQWSYINQAISKFNLRKQSFEETELRRQGLSELINNYSQTSITINSDTFNDNSFLVEMPSDFWLPISEKVSCTKEICGADQTKKLAIIPVSHDEINQNENSPYKKPYYNEIGGLVWKIQLAKNTIDSDKRIELISDGSYSLDKYHLRYIKTPPNIVVDRETTANQVNCILDENIQKIIINLSVKLIKEASERPQLNNISPIEKSF